MGVKGVAVVTELTLNGVRLLEFRDTHTKIMAEKIPQAGCLMEGGQGPRGTLYV